MLRGELDEAYQKMGRLQEQQQLDRLEKSLLERGHDEAYREGYRQATEELSLENEKLRKMIENLHSEVSAKQKLIAEANFKIGDLEKQVQLLSTSFSDI